MKKRTKTILKNAVLIFILITGSAFMGFGARDFYPASEEEELIDLGSYLEDGKFKGVDIYIYEGWDESFEKFGYTRNFTSKINGFYSKQGIIFINTEDRTDGQILRTLFHEYGHHIWNKVISENDKERYKTIYSSADLYVSSYALYGGVEEDFAESYEAMMVGFEGVPYDRESFFYDMRLKHPIAI